MKKRAFVCKIKQRGTSKEVTKTKQRAYRNDLFSRVFWRNIDCVRLHLSRPKEKVCIY